MDKQTLDFINRLHVGGAFGHYWTAQGRRSSWFESGSAPSQPNDKKDIYFGVHPTSIIPPTNRKGKPKPPSAVRSQIKHLAVINCLFSEFDARDNNGSKAQTLARVESLTVLPSVIVDSGGGYHAYWILDESYADIEKAREYQYRWVEFTGGDGGAKDLARILRVPGTRNLKPKYGPDAPIVSFVRCELGRTFKLADLVGLMPEPDVKSEPVKVPARPLPILTGDRMTDRKTAYWERAVITAREIVERAADGEKHIRLLEASHLLGGYVGGGLGDRGDAVEVLRRAIESKSNVADMGAAFGTIDDGIDYGMTKPITFEQKERERLDWMDANPVAIDEPPWPTEPPPQEMFESPLFYGQKKTTFSAIDDVMSRLKKMREEQAKAWLSMISDPGAKPPNLTDECRALMKDAGALDELQIQEVLDEIMRNPPLAPRKRVDLLRIWRVARKIIKDAMAGKATDDEIAMAYQAQYANTRIYTRSRWYQWEPRGVWSDDADVRDEIWSTMCEFKKVDVKPSSHKRHSIEECLQGRSFMGVHPSKMDAHPEWINLLNGVYDFVDKTLTEHSHDQYMTTQLPFDYDPNAPCPRWLSFLDQVLVQQDGAPDQEMIAFMRQAFGYSLTAWTKYETSFWLQGGGANGKSTLIHILSAMTGTASMALNLGMLERDQYQLALLPGIRVVTCTESPVGLKVADSMIKSLVSGDTLSVRLPYGKPFQLEPQCKIWWAMNNYPRVADTSDGFWRKVRVIPFLASFNGKKRDENLRHKLEAELPGILNWALDGLNDLIADGWTKCAAIDRATDIYRQSNDVEMVFVTECCQVGDGFQVGAKQLYDAYRDWCISTGHRPKTSTRVSTDWLRLGFRKRRASSGIVYSGIGLSQIV